MRKIVTILGARPQFIKAATVSRAIAEHNKEQPMNQIQEVIVHTGQHFDANMSDIFFDELDIPKPNYKLNISSLSHGAMTGRMLEAIEELLLVEKPNWVLVYGDTNSTLAGALAAAKLHISIIHVEAGLRSHNITMPEEVNRILTDRVSDYLFCPTQVAVNNLMNEGFPFLISTKQKQRIENVGDVMYDAMLYYQEKAKESVNLCDFEVQEKAYALCTLHRQENTDDPVRLENILSALRVISTDICPVVLPLHPRTRKKIDALGENHWLKGVKILEPIAYLQMQRLQMSAKMILTDSGGVQKEAFFHSVPCITLRDETEWVETVEAGWNSLVGANKEAILNSAKLDFSKLKPNKVGPYGDGFTAKLILDKILSIEV